MCNQYNLTTTTEAMIRLRMEWERAMRNTPPLSIYPDYNAPIVRQVEDRRLISLARWGLPSLRDPVTEKVNKGTTNVRHPWFDVWKGVSRRRASLPGAVRQFRRADEAR